MTSPRRPVGRPRSAAKDAAILTAGLQLLSHDGYARMSMDAVAAAAGVSKQTLYARYAGKAELVAAAIAALDQDAVPEVSGDLRTDLLTELDQLRDLFDRVDGTGILAACLAERRHTPELLVQLREHTLLPRRARIAAVLNTAKERQEIDERTEPQTVVSMLLGSLYADLVAGRPVTNATLAAAVDHLLTGLKPQRP
ncbi:TetR/AcrR family transcriptional regulator [Amycolatopsis sp. NPDC051903]|uniref:TetR/AcrR family transcriptional regulator n=1 Tax=Amycolatopsis sp. NPDC051903 TaxID=3363936 RepID=UPI00378F6C3F